MANTNEHKTQRYFVKDGDDDYVPRRPQRKYPSQHSAPKVAFKKCECGGKLKPRGTIGVEGRVSSKCNKCGRRVYSKLYKGRDGLVRCY